MFNIIFLIFILLTAGQISPAPKLESIGFSNITLLDNISAASWSPGGHLIATATNSSIDSEIKIWEIEPNEGLSVNLVQAVKVPLKVTLIKWSPDGRKLALISWGTIQVLESRNLSILFTKDIFTTTLAWHPDSLAIAVATQELNILDANTGKTIQTLYIPEEIQPIGNTWTIRQLEWGYDENTILSINPDVLLWNLTTGNLEVLDCCAEGTYMAKWSPDGELFADHYGIHDISNRSRNTLFNFPNEFGFYSNLAWQPNGKLIAALPQTGLDIIDTATGNILWSLESDDVYIFAEWSSQQQDFITLRYDGELILWHMEN